MLSRRSLVACWILFRWPTLVIPSSYIPKPAYTGPFLLNSTQGLVDYWISLPSNRVSWDSSAHFHECHVRWKPLCIHRAVERLTIMPRLRWSNLEWQSLGIDYVKDWDSTKERATDLTWILEREVCSISRSTTKLVEESGSQCSAICGNTLQESTAANFIWLTKHYCYNCCKIQSFVTFASSSQATAKPASETVTISWSRSSKAAWSSCAVSTAKINASGLAWSISAEAARSSFIVLSNRLTMNFVLG